MKKSTILTACIFFIASSADAGMLKDWQNCKSKILYTVKRNQFVTADQQYCAGLGLAFGRWGTKDRNGAVEWYQKAAAQGHAGAQVLLAYSFEKGYGVKQNYKEAIRYYSAAAKQGNEDAMYNMGRLYAGGRGVDPSMPIAIRWYTAAAKRGSDDAKKALRKIKSPVKQWPRKDLFDKGVALYKDKKYEEAATLFLQAAKAGNALAQLQIGYQYEKGEGLEISNEQAFKWYKLSAENGVSTAQANLGYMFEDGLGTKENWKLALYWYKKSAAQFNDLGQFRLGRMYQFGMAVPQNTDTALSWFLKASAQNNPQARYIEKHISDGGCIGYRNEIEFSNYMRVCAEPRGKTFYTSGQRMAWLAKEYAKLPPISSSSLPSSSSRSSSNKDSQGDSSKGTASQNAWGAGDTDAYNRIQNGTATWSDKSRYGY